ncbi:hypothetical protein [Bradyrhizobium sp. OAE829]|uniref:hypothetical protein n=1 Tax=Bradyrhizobium sp. OAE829 TaxID=2663807 RepID=UPI00178BE512
MEILAQGASCPKAKRSKEKGAEKDSSSSPTKVSDVSYFQRFLGRTFSPFCVIGAEGGHPALAPGRSSLKMIAGPLTDAKNSIYERELLSDFALLPPGNTGFSRLRLKRLNLV